MDWLDEADWLDVADIIDPEPLKVVLLVSADKCIKILSNIINFTPDYEVFIILIQTHKKISINFLLLKKNLNNIVNCHYKLSPDFLIYKN